jgi:hypothetical protein
VYLQDYLTLKVFYADDAFGAIAIMSGKTKEKKDNIKNKNNKKNKKKQKKFLITLKNP